MRRERRRNGRSLYECANARVLGGRILCRCGHTLHQKSEDGGIDAALLARGKPLVYRACRACPDFEEMGPPLPPHERGWSKEEVKKDDSLA